MRRLSAGPILALAPLLVLAIAESGSPPVLDQLRQAGIEVRPIADRPSPDGVVAKIRDVAQALELTAAGEALAGRISAAFADLPRQIGARSGTRAMFVLSTGRCDHPPGGVNVVAALEGYKPLSPEAAIEAAPDMLFAVERTVGLMGGPDAVVARPDLALTPAGRNRALVSMDGLLLGFGPRTPEAARRLAGELATFAPEPAAVRCSPSCMISILPRGSAIRSTSCRRAGSRRWARPRRC